MGTLLQDVRYGLRMLVKTPGLTVVAVLSLALGIGANTSIFSVVHAVLLRPLPYVEPGQLMKIFQTSVDPGKFGMPSLWTYPRFEALRDSSETFAAVAAYASRAYNLTGTDEPERLRLEFVSASYLPVLGIQALAGRVFTPEEDKVPGAHPVALIGYGLWQRRFGGDTSILGRTIEMERHSLTVVGILPKGFKGQSGTAEVWLPTMMVSTLWNRSILTEPGLHWVDVIGRLKPGITQAQAQAEMEIVSDKIKRLVPSSEGEPPGKAKDVVMLVPLKETTVEPPIRRSLLILLAAVGFVLLIACANTANLLLARAVTRQKEFAVRLAVGASRSRILRQLLTESLLLSMIGGLLGVVVALWGIDLLTTFRPTAIGQFWTQYSRTFEFFTVHLDGHVLAFTFLISLASGILFGLVPALPSSRCDVNEALKDSADGLTVGFRHPRRQSARSVLAVLEIALALVLLIGAGLMIKSFARLQAVKLGFEPENVLTLTVYSDEAKLGFYKELLARTSALPGVESVSVSSSAPLSGASLATTLEIEGRPSFQGRNDSIVGLHTVSPDYFKTLRITVLKGRGFTEQDRAGAKRVAIINETVARRYWPGEDPLGKRIKLGIVARYPNADDLIEIVGVANDVKYGRVEEVIEPDVYLCYLQPIESTRLLIIRTATDPAGLIGAVRHEVTALNKNIPLYDVRTMADRRAAAISRARFGALLLALFASLALVLSAIGIYGTMAYAVSRRTHEIGIRVALGARSGDVLRLVVRDGLALTVAGLVAGLAVAYGTTRVLSSQLYEVSATDFGMFAGVSALLAVVALLACYIPARRATKVDPLVALRYE